MKEEVDSLYQEAVKEVRKGETASVSKLQRDLKIGYNRAAKLMSAMENEGVILPMNEKGIREVNKQLVKKKAAPKKKAVKNASKKKSIPSKKAVDDDTKSPQTDKKHDDANKRSAPNKKKSTLAKSKGPGVKTKEKKLDAKETVFRDQYLLTNSPYDAAIAAGYSETMAKTKAYTWVSDGKCPNHKIHLYNEIKKLQIERSKKTGIDAEWLLKRLAAEATADVADLYFESGTLKPVHEWPLIWRQGLVGGLDVEQKFEYIEGEKVPDGYVTKLKLSDRIKRLELIGKHIDVQAFKEKLEVDLKGGLADRMSRARERKGD